MKTKLFTLLALSFGLCACSDSEREYVPDTVTPVDAVDIRLSQQLVGTRAVIKDGDNLTATVFMCDGAMASWVGFTPKMANTIDADKKLVLRANTSVATFKASTSVAGQVDLLPVLYYDNLNQINPSWMKAVSPKGTLETNTNGISILFDTPNGEQDILFAPAVITGTHKNPTGVALIFEHQTSQLSFAIKLKPHIPANVGAWLGKTVSLKSVQMQTATLPHSFNVIQDKMIWGTPAALAIPGITTQVIGETATNAGRPVMINSSTELYVNAVLVIDGKDVNFNNIPIYDADNNGTIKLETKIGESHLVTITVVEPAAASGSIPITSVSATVQAWKAGTPGSVTLE